MRCKNDKRIRGDIKEGRIIVEKGTLEGKVDKIALEVSKNSKVIEGHTKALEGHTKAIEGIALEVSKNTEAIEGLVTKEEFAEFKNENFTRLDKTLAILTRLDQERLFTFERVKRIEEEIEKIKAHLAIN
jgi:hypothetical protein